MLTGSKRLKEPHYELTNMRQQFTQKISFLVSLKMEIFQTIKHIDKLPIMRIVLHEMEKERYQAKLTCYKGAFRSSEKTTVIKTNN